MHKYLSYEPVELSFGTSGLRGLVADMTDLECYINTRGFLNFVTDGYPNLEAVYLAGDLRKSTPRIMQAVSAAVLDEGLELVNCGFIPTPALALAAQDHHAVGIMVTGSHIPDDRNGIKFYKREGEVLKCDEPSIKAQVEHIRQSIYGTLQERFERDGSLKRPVKMPPVDHSAEVDYIKRYTQLYEPDSLAGKKIVLYEHSAVGRDLIAKVLSLMGAEVLPVGRSDVFIPIDTENVTKKDRRYFKKLADEYDGCFAIVSTDGDSDRPFVIDDEGEFHRGDVLGAIVAQSLPADFVVYPVSSSDALDMYFHAKGVQYVHTKIGSPYVIEAMNAGAKSNDIVVGWEVNGGFLVAKDVHIRGKILKKLATRDALLPILVALTSASDRRVSLKSLFADLPQRATQAGMLDNFPIEVARHILGNYGEDNSQNRIALQSYFTEDLNFGKITNINNTDGIRISFNNGDIAHIRPSGNAPQLRIYSVADSQGRADEIVSMAVDEPQGILRKIEKVLNETSSPNG